MRLCVRVRVFWWNVMRSLFARISSFQMGRSDQAIRLHGKTNSYIELALNTSRWSAANGAVRPQQVKAVKQKKGQKILPSLRWCSKTFLKINSLYIKIFNGSGKINVEQWGLGLQRRKSVPVKFGCAVVFALQRILIIFPDKEKQTNRQKNPKNSKD